MKADTLLQVHHAFVYAAYTKKKLDGIELHLIPPGLLAEAFHGFTEQAPAPVLKCNGAGSLQVRPSPVQKNRASGMYRLPWCGGDEEDRTLDLTDANRTLSQAGQLYASQSVVEKGRKLSI